jgi:hypothetical protein
MYSGIAEETVTGMTYLNTLQLWLMQQLQNKPTFIFQQDGSPAHFHCEVRQYLNAACGKNLNIASMCAVSPVVHTSNISSCQKKTFSVFLWL